MAGVQISNVGTKQDSMLGSNYLNFTYVSSNNFTCSGMVECAGAYYRFVDEPVTVLITEYIKVVPSANPEDKTATLESEATLPTFDSDKNGYYVSATNERVIASRNMGLSHVENIVSGNQEINKLHADEVIIENYTQFKRGIIPAVIVRGSLTEGTIFTSLEDYVPNVNDSKVISGGRGAVCLSHMIRTASNTINLYGTDSGGLSDYTVRQGNGTYQDVSIAI